MILVTGAAGKTGRAVISALTRRDGDSVRALVLNEAGARAASETGASEVVLCDMLDAPLVQQATKGIQAIYHICPNMHPEEVQIGKIIIASAKNEGIQHFVYHSVLHPQIEQMPHHWNKLRVEELLFESSLPFTILQPSPYMQNMLGSWPAITEKGVYATPYPLQTKLSLVDLEDVGEVAAKTLMEAGHDGAIYELVGTAPMTQTRVAEILSQQLSRPVLARELPLETWRLHARSSGLLTEYAIETLVKMFCYYAKYGLGGNPSVLAFLLGRPPTSLSAFVARVGGRRPT
jgi:NAD(P)H dehydrogenase (quinone)